MKDGQSQAYAYVYIFPSNLTCIMYIRIVSINMCVIILVVLAWLMYSFYISLGETLSLVQLVTTPISAACAVVIFNSQVHTGTSPVHSPLVVQYLVLSPLRMWPVSQV